MRRPRLLLLAHPRGMHFTRLVWRGRLEVTLIWSLFWWRWRPLWSLVTWGRAGGTRVLRVGPVVIAWPARSGRQGGGR